MLKILLASAIAATAWAGPAAPVIDVYKSPSCGLIVPAMPMGSPGMEQGNHKDPYDVLLVKRDGSTQTYSRY